MVSAPKCKVCGAQHGAGQPHVWSGEAAKVVSTPKSPPAAKTPDQRPALTINEMEQFKALVAKEEARKAKVAAYMRSYRARRRAP